MKSKHVILASSLLFSVALFAQKDQIKAAEKAMKGGNPLEAIKQLDQAESLIGAASDAEKAQFYFVKGNALKDMADKKMDPAKNFVAAAKSYQSALAAEKASGKSKYTADAESALSQVKTSMLTAAQTEIENKRYKQGADLLNQSYEIDKTNLDNLYAASVYYLKGEDYDAALKGLLALKSKNYTGEGTNYYAKSAVTDQEEYYGNSAQAKKDRDDKVRLKLASAPRDEKLTSKRGEIARYTALILVQQGKMEEAKAAINEAKAVLPDDVDLLQAEANIYLTQKDMENYRKVTKILIEKNPNDADLLFNLGVASTDSDPAGAEEFYKKAIAIKPNYHGAYINLALLKIGNEKKLVDEMNKLGNSEKDNKRYEVLKKQRDGMFQSAIPYLEKAYEIKADDQVADMLLNMYGALEMTDKKKAFKAKIGR
jgi:hypothetical protein